MPATLGFMAKKTARKSPAQEGAKGGPVLYVRMPEALRKAFEDYMKQDPLEKDRQENGIDAITEFLERRKFWPPKPDSSK
jgi:type I site-specific restriction-modification system R (restriction) subunit